MRSPPDNSPRLGTTIFAAVFSWAVVTVGFVGLKILMDERPQFVGQPMTSTRAVLVQESPQIVVRKATDDVAAIKPAQPDSSIVHFEMKGRRDYRGLKTISDMSGQFRAEHVLANDSDDPLFVLFRSPHPRNDASQGSTVLASALRLEASVPGLQENAADAWLWSGTLPARSRLTIAIRYDVGALRGVTYNVRAPQGDPVKQLKVTFQRQDLDTVRFGSGDGSDIQAGNTVVWERTDFLPPDHFSAQLIEGRNLFTSLSQLVEIGPAISLLFLLAALAAILARQPLSAVQVFTISAGYALYFPLLLYLSARFTFAVALVAAVLVPGILLVNYARWLLGTRAGLVGGIVFLGLYQVFPTLAAFAGWNRGMVLLALGVVTLWVLIQLQNQALRRAPAAATATAALVFALLPLPAPAGEPQVLVPLTLAEALRAPAPEVPALVSFEPAQYRVLQETTHLRVTVSVPFQVLRAGNTPIPLFAAPVHRTSEDVKMSERGGARLVQVANRLGLLAENAGRGSLDLSYRVPVENRDGKKRAQIPLLVSPSGSVRLESPRGDLEVLSGSLWTKTAGDPLVTYDIGVAGEEALVLEWREQGGSTPAAGTEQLYGIGVTAAQHLTVIHSDGSCTHFAEFEIPAALAENFRMRLPAGARLISASLNGTEIAAPAVRDQAIDVRLPNRDPRHAAHRLSFRLEYPPQRLGFIGLAQLALPELFQSVGTLEWVLALPTGFSMEVVSSGLEIQRAPSDLKRFGDYGRVLQNQPHTVLAKHLVPPGPMNLSIKYRQRVPGFFAASP